VRIGAVYEWKQNIRYRSLNPLEALQRRGHEVRFAREGVGYAAGALHAERLGGCDVVHGYRNLLPEEVALVQECIRAGAAFVWDTDDDLAAAPSEGTGTRGGGLHAQRIFARTLQIARLADVVTTSTERLAERYRASGIERVEVLGNYLAPEVMRSRRRRHEGIVIGWIAGLEHAADLARIPVVDALRRLLDVHPRLRVASIGVDLGLPRERYEHHGEVPIKLLQDHLGRWDLGIAPLADTPFNRARSDVKLKEYASVGIPWLASPVGPYAGLGAAQGGELVADDGWHGALERLATRRLARLRLGRRARAWARTQSIERHAERWERVCAEAIERRARRGGDPRARRGRA
jgi:glycosyltransferase involved in cell wall biosynthesis